MKIIHGARAAVAAFLTGIIAALLLVLSLTVKTRSRVEPAGNTPAQKEEGIDQKIQRKAEAARLEGEDALRGRTPRDVCHDYEGVGRAVDDGRNRFIARAKNRILKAGGSGADE